jgi:protein-tyrosine phosphatase
MSDPLSVWIRDRYGGKRALLRLCTTRSAAFGGRYGKYLDLDYGRVERLVFVCKGNICRSPYAEVRARAMGGDSVSAGLDAQTGSPANPVATRVAATVHVDLREHRAQRLDQVRLRRNDLLIAFEPAHLPALAEAQQTMHCQVTLLGLFGGVPSPYIHDPYGCSERYFSVCFRRLDGLLEGLFSRLLLRDAPIRGPG